MAEKQPNIVVIMADFLGALALPMYGNTTVSAPNLKRLGEAGVVFENAYCNVPLCGPSRASFLTGLLPSKVGVYDNGSELPASIPTFAHYLRLAGYRTFLTGKMHFTGPDQLHGFEERLTTDVVPSDFGWSPPPGGAHAELDDAYPPYPNLDAVIDAGPCVRALGITYDDEVTFTSINKIHEMARQESEQPFLLTISFIQPHPPYQPVEKGVIDRVSRHGEAYRGEGGFAILRDDEDDLNDQDGSSGRNKHEQGANSARHGLLRGAGADELAHQQR